MTEWFEVLMWEKGELLCLLLTHASHVLLKQLGYCLQSRRKVKCS